MPGTVLGTESRVGLCIMILGDTQLQAAGGWGDPECGGARMQKAGMREPKVERNGRFLGGDYL